MPYKVDLFHCWIFQVVYFVQYLLVCVPPRTAGSCICVLIVLSKFTWLYSNNLKSVLTLIPFCKCSKTLGGGLSVLGCFRIEEHSRQSYFAAFHFFLNYYAKPRNSSLLLDYS